LLDRLLDRRGGTIQQLDLAMEVLVSTYLEAESRYEYVAKRLRRRWAKKPWVYRIPGGQTFYTAKKRWPSDKLAVYAGESKLEPGSPCVRIERRIRGSYPVSRCFAGLRNFQELTKLDFAEFWNSHISFEEADYTKLGRQARGRSKAKRPDEFRTRAGIVERDRLTGRRIARLAAYECGEEWGSGGCSTQALRYLCKRFP